MTSLPLFPDFDKASSSRKFRSTEEQQLEMVALYESGIHAREIAEKFGCSHRCILWILHRRGIRVRSKGESKRMTYALDEESIVAAYVSGQTSEEIAKQFGCHGARIRDILRRHGIRIRSISEGRRLDYPVDETVFDTMNSESLYWAGLLMADGTIHYGSGQPAVGLTLHEDDMAHVESFKAFLKTKNAVVHGPGVAMMTVHSHRLAEALGRYGIVPRKSLIAKAADEVVTHSEVKHFFRGLIDGDGGVYLAEVSKGRGCRRVYPSIRLCGASGIMEQWLAYARKLLPDSRAGLIRDKRSENHWSHGLVGYSAAIMTRHLYGGCAVALPRKMRTAEKIMAWEDVRRD